MVRIDFESVYDSLVRIAGQCMVTLGTGRSSNVQWRDVCLLPSHSYAVIG